MKQFENTVASIDELKSGELEDFPEESIKNLQVLQARGYTVSVWKESVQLEIEEADCHNCGDNVLEDRKFFTFVTNAIPGPELVYCTECMHNLDCDKVTDQFFALAEKHVEVDAEINA
ncbi:MAG: hypothetical protein ABEJ56_04420 [Candidatus Nanohaloarchaea archaeon]